MRNEKKRALASERSGLCTTQAEGASNWLLLPNFLGLDAVLVAVLWQSVAAYRLGTWNSAAEIATLGLAVFSIYTLDRLRDSYVLDGRARPRHLFALRHRVWLMCALAGAVLSGMALALLRLPSQLQLAGVAFFFVLLGYYLWTHARGAFTEKGCSKECVIGAVFALGVFLAPASHAAAASGVVLRMVAGFALLCALNCLVISFCEARPAPKSYFWLALLVAVAVQSVLAYVSVLQRPFHVALLCSYGLLAAVMALRNTLTPDWIPLCADMALVLGGVAAFLL